jgi:hypothetical protein
MKNTILCGAILTVLCAQAQADTNETMGQANSNSVTTPVPQPAMNSTQPMMPVQAQPATATPAQVATPPAINCDYKIDATVKTIDQALVLTWSEKATTQAFDFDPTAVDAQMQKLQTCFTDQGWTGFNTALQKSGNLEAIKSQHLTVSSQIDGHVQMEEAKDNQWKVALPIQVVYQNEKEKVTQLLNIQLMVGRKTNGDLGITQMIATPRPSAAEQNTSTTSTAPMTTPGDNTNAPVTTTPPADSTTPILAPTPPTDATQPTSPTDATAPTVGSPTDEPNT